MLSSYDRRHDYSSWFRMIYAELFQLMAFLKRGCLICTRWKNDLLTNNKILSSRFLWGTDYFLFRVLVVVGVRSAAPRTDDWSLPYDVPRDAGHALYPFRLSDFLYFTPVTSNGDTVSRWILELAIASLWPDVEKLDVLQFDADSSSQSTYCIPTSLIIHRRCSNVCRRLQVSPLKSPSVQCTVPSYNSPSISHLFHIFNTYSFVFIPRNLRLWHCDYHYISSCVFN